MSAQRFGGATLAALVIANMIGAGVFTTSGLALADLHTPGRVMLAWLLGGVIALCGALSYGALAHRLTDSGGEYLYLSRVVHPAAGFVAGWVSLLAGFTGAIAFAATAFETYALPAGVRPAWLPADSVAITLIVVAAVAHGGAARVGALGQNALVVVKLVVIAVLVAAAIHAAPADAWHLGVAGEVPSLDGLAFAQAVMWISLSYSGFNAAVYVAGEARDARHSVPRALVVGTLAVFVIYIALNALFVMLPPTAAVSGQAAVAAHAARAIGGTTLAGWVGVAVALALASSVSSMMMAGPRVYARMAADGLMPRWLARDEAAPMAAVALQAVLAIVVVLATELRALLSYLGFTLSLSAALTVASLFVLARREGSSTVAMWGFPWIPAVFIVATVTTAALSAVREPLEPLAGLLTVAVGLAAWRVQTRRRSDAGS